MFVSLILTLTLTFSGLDFVFLLFLGLYVYYLIKLFTKSVFCGQIATKSNNRVLQLEAVQHFKSSFLNCGMPEPRTIVTYQGGPQVFYKKLLAIYIPLF